MLSPYVLSGPSGFQDFFRVNQAGARGGGANGAISPNSTAAQIIDANGTEDQILELKSDIAYQIPFSLIANG